MAALTNLLDLEPAALVRWCGDMGEKPFRAKQLQRWIHQFGESDFDAMTVATSRAASRNSARGTTCSTLP